MSAAPAGICRSRALRFLPVLLCVIEDGFDLADESSGTLA
jgi:hypothetical protein